MLTNVSARPRTRVLRGIPLLLRFWHPSIDVHHRRTVCPSAGTDCYVRNRRSKKPMGFGRRARLTVNALTTSNGTKASDFAVK